MPVLVDVDLDVHHDPSAHGSGWVGVVGANGAGKSTLLRLLAGDLVPTAGTATVESRQPPLLLHQEVDGLPDPVQAFGRAWDGHSARLRSRLDLDPDDLEPGLGRGWAALSPGLRARWRIAAALAADPDVLLLDEPTNHLDRTSRDVVLAALTEHRGLGLVVSHDRALLDRLTTRTLRLHDGTAELHDGAYSTAAAQWRREEEAAARRRDRAERRVARERELLAEHRRARHGAEASAARALRTAGHRDTDAREAGRKFRAARSEAALASRVQAQHARLDRATDAATQQGHAGRDHRGDVRFNHDAGRGSLLTFEGDVDHPGGSGTLLSDVALDLDDGDHVRIDGRNGAGKSTLLRALVEAAPVDAVGVLSQELDGDLTWLDTLAPRQRGRVLGTAARLGVVPDRVLDAAATSPGERRKLALAALLADDLRLLVLDEPTNHLDLPAIEALQAALVAWPGALLLVTHDDRLAAAATDRTWKVADGHVQVSG